MGRKRQDERSKIAGALADKVALPMLGAARYFLAHESKKGTDPKKAWDAFLRIARAVWGDTIAEAIKRGARGQMTRRTKPYIVRRRRSHDGSR